MSDLSDKMEELTLLVHTYLHSRDGEESEVARRLTRLEDDSIEYGKGFEKLNNFLHKTEHHVRRLQEDISSSDLVTESLKIAHNFKQIKDSVSVAREYLDEFLDQIKPKA